MFFYEELMVMLNLSIHNGERQVNENFGVNWEEDIQHVGIETCDLEEDPLGYQAIYYKDSPKNKIVKSYIIGASCLTKRLLMLKKGGFNAPMTEEALRMVCDKFFVSNKCSL